MAVQLQLWNVWIVGLAGVLAVFYSGKAPWLAKHVNRIVHGKAGCAPVSDLGNVTFHYFKVRGRAEPIRMILEEAEIPYNELNEPDDTWSKRKKKGIETGLYPFGQLPYFETQSGVRLVQSHAILHYIGRATGMDCDCDEMHKCEMLAGGIEDIRSRLAQVLHDPKFSLKSRDVYLTNTLPTWLGYFEKLAPSLAQTTNTESFFASSRLTWVDFLIFAQLDSNVDFGKLEMVSKAKKYDILEDFPKLRAYYNNMARRPKIAKYFKSSRRLKYSLVKLPIDA